MRKSNTNNMGCAHYTEGESVDEAIVMAHDAIELAISVRRDEGDEIPASDADVVHCCGSGSLKSGKPDRISSYGAEP